MAVCAEGVGIEEVTGENAAQSISEVDVILGVRFEELDEDWVLILFQPELEVRICRFFEPIINLVCLG